MASSPPAPDPRPVVVDVLGEAVVRGRRCSACNEVSAFAWPCCPRCRGELSAADFGPRGRVWSSTVVRIAVTDRVPPYRLAYVDLDDGPRILAHLAGDGGPADVGSLVRLIGVTPHGDVLAEVCA